ncbi:MAG TPA: hypothetical protein VHG31_01835 [Stellaceae bacterium]|nr:hypothetical protein [Stellaceae bacterium]
MGSLRKALFAGIAAIGIAISGVASAQNAHVMTVPIPGGGVAQIRYVGDVPPQIVFVPAPAAFEGWMPVSSVFGYASPFAMLDRIAAEMDRRAAAMFRYAEAMTDRANAGGFADAAFGAMPLGSQSYSYVSTISGNGVCTQSIRITSRGDGAPPRVERHSSGNCGAAVAPPGRSRVQPAAPVPAAPPKQPDLILTQGTGGSPYAGMIRHVASAAR